MFPLQLRSDTQIARGARLGNRDRMLRVTAETKRCHGGPLRADAWLGATQHPRTSMWRRSDLLFVPLTHFFLLSVAVHRSVITTQNNTQQNPSEDESVPCLSVLLSNGQFNGRATSLSSCLREFSSQPLIFAFLLVSVKSASSQDNEGRCLCPFLWFPSL